MVPDRKSILTLWRRILFMTWIGASALIALFVLIGGPLLSTDGVDQTRWIAFGSYAAMAIFIFSGLAWLILLMMSRRSS